MDHSPAQLRLLCRAAARIEANDGLLMLSTTYAATAAAQVKEGRKVYEKLQGELVKKSKG